MCCDGSQGSGPAAHLRLGTPLLVTVHGRTDPLKFEDLDDLINSFAEPLVDHVQDLLSHEKFVDGAWETVQVRHEDTRQPYSASAPKVSVGVSVKAPFMVSSGLTPTQA